MLPQLKVWASLVAQVKNLPANVGNPGLIPGLGRSPGEGHGNPLQCSCLENPMDRGAQQATVHGTVELDIVTKQYQITNRQFHHQLGSFGHQDTFKRKRSSSTVKNKFKKMIIFFSYSNDGPLKFSSSDMVMRFHIFLSPQYFIYSFRYYILKLQHFCVHNILIQNSDLFILL